jgi:hypothetical protein
MSITFRDFQAINKWTLDITGPKWDESQEPQYIIDDATGRKYLNEDFKVVGFKCFLLTLGTPFVHSVASVCNIAYRILKLITFSHFWIKQKGEYNIIARLAEAGKDLLRIVATPLSIIGLELAAIYGAISSPYDGRKIYASFERAVYGNSILAPCFQPDPKSHAFGGNINQKNAF